MAGGTPTLSSNVIELEDEPEESEKEVPLVRSASKRKGKEKIQGLPKRARFASDPELYALARESEAELLFGRPSFVLPTERPLPVSSTPLTPTFGEPLDESPVGETCLEPVTLFGDPPPAEPETSLGLGNDFETGTHLVAEPGDHLETGAVDLPEPVGEDLDPNIVLDSPRADGHEEPRTETPNPLPCHGEASTSRQGVLEALLEVLPKEPSSIPETDSPGELVEALLHAQLQVSFMS